MLLFPQATFSGRIRLVWTSTSTGPQRMLCAPTTNGKARPRNPGRGYLLVLICGRSARSARPLQPGQAAPILGVAAVAHTLEVGAAAPILGVAAAVRILGAAVVAWAPILPTKPRTLMHVLRGI